MAAELASMAADLLPQPIPTPTAKVAVDSSRLVHLPFPESDQSGSLLPRCPVLVTHWREGFAQIGVAERLLLSHSLDNLLNNGVVNTRLCACVLVGHDGKTRFADERVTIEDKLHLLVEPCAESLLRASCLSGKGGS